MTDDEGGGSLDSHVAEAGVQLSLVPLVAGTKGCNLLVTSTVQLCPNGHGVLDRHLPYSNRPAGP